MSIPNFLSIHIGKFLLFLRGVIKGGIGIRWFDKPRKNNHHLVLTLKRPALLNIDAKVRFHHLYLPYIDLKNPTWKQYLPQKTLYLQLGWASFDAPTPNKLLVGI